MAIAQPRVSARSEKNRTENGSASQPAQPGKPIPRNQNTAQQILFEADLNKQIETATVDAQVQMLLPHSEAQWEAWARKEYLHIMWVYDVLTKPKYGINWDGKPVNIPEWAKKVWTDEATCPTGWRALMCYSGEVLNSDYPEAVDAPNVRPTIQTMKIAAEIAGCNFQICNTGDWRIPMLKSADMSNINRVGNLALASFFSVGCDLGLLMQGPVNA